MALSGKRVGVIVALTVLALTGLIVLQVSLLSYAMEIKEQAFKHNATTALAQISHALRIADASAMLNAASDNEVEGRRARFVSVITGGTLGEIDEFSWSTNTAAPGSDTALETVGRNVRRIGEGLANVTLKVGDRPDSLDSAGSNLLVDSNFFEVNLESDGYMNSAVVYSFRSDSDSGRVQREHLIGDTSDVRLYADSLNPDLMSSVISKVFGFTPPPLQERLDSINVDSIVSATMAGSGITIEYAFGIFADYPDTVRYVPQAMYTEELQASDLKAHLFHQDLHSRPARVSLYFPEREAYLWAQITPLVSAEVLFMLIIIACFAYTIRTILKQRTFSALLVEFINNMTHEFKTPISTVALATEAIERPDVLAQKDKVLQFNKMIRTEITRMRNQTEKILQMATLEDGDIALTKSEMDLHQTIRDAVDAVSIQIEHRGGRITTRLDAGTSQLHADPLHIANIIHNLLDNAVKYSDDAPHIEVRTFRTDDEIAVEIEDHGLGMSAEHQKQAFQKYFRVPTGNLHNVKGFGLGLSYVKLMIEAHDGAVQLEGEPGRGTTVRIVLPIGLTDEK
jgi:two-component system phosphate regulon sensor histidine kinase PhoR